MTDATTDQQDQTGAASEEAAADEAALWAELEAEDAASRDDAGPSDQDRQGDVHDDGEAEGNGSEGAADAGDGSQVDGSSQGAQPGGDQPSGQDATQADIWANATPEQRAAFEAARDAAKSADGLREQLNRRMREINKLKNLTTTATSRQAASDGAATGSDKGDDGGDFLGSDDWKSLKEEYPEIAGPLEQAIRAERAKTTRLEKEMSAIGDDRRQEALDEQASALLEVHPDWMDLVGATEAETDEQRLENEQRAQRFSDWVAHQPRHVREAVERNKDAVVDAEEAADVLGRFKAFMAVQQNGQGNGQGSATERPQPNGGQGGNGNNQAQPLSDKRKRQLESALSVRSRGPAAATGIPEDGDPEAIWDAFERMEKRAGL